MTWEFFTDDKVSNADAESLLKHIVLKEDDKDDRALDVWRPGLSRLICADYLSKD